MSGSILFFPFAEEAVKDRELDHQKLQPCAVCFQFFRKLTKHKLTWPTFEKHFYLLQFSFVVSLVFSLTEQFEIFCLPRNYKLATIEEKFDVSLCQIF